MVGMIQKIGLDIKMILRLFMLELCPNIDSLQRDTLEEDYEGDFIGEEWFRI